MVLLLLSGVLIVSTILYYYFTWHFDYWRNRGVIGPTPLPIVGTFRKSALFWRNFIYDQNEIYQEYREKAPFVGIYTHRTPELLVLDPYLVKEILVGKFKHFHTNYTNYNKENARLFSRNPFVLRNEEWKDNRADISPAFTTTKTKLTYPVVDQMCKRLISFIKSNVCNSKNPMDTKDITAKFTADVICSVAYGLDANAIADDSSTFLQVSRKLFTPSYSKLWFITFKSLFPRLFTYYEMPFLKQDVEKYFVDLTDAAIRMRNESNDQPDDYLNFVLKLKERRGLEVSDVAAHTITFFLDAYETSSIILTHALYQLAKSPHCQRTLRSKLLDYESLDFNIINNLDYLDYVFNETLRISPPGFTITKVCTEPIEFENHKKQPVRIEQGTAIHIPIHAIQNDCNYFPDPNTFDPDRFEGVDLKMLRDEGKFFPFGNGPRICLGMRFSTLQIKMAIAEIVRHFHLSVNKRTKEPIIVHPKDYLYLSIRDVYLNYEPIESD